MNRWVLLLFFLSLSDFGQAQFSELKNLGLKGKVKIVTEYNYYNILQSDGSWKVKDSTKWFSRNIRYFNEKGNLDSSIVSFDYSYLPFGGMELAEKCKYFYMYNKNGLETSIVIICARDNDLHWQLNHLFDNGNYVFDPNNKTIHRYQWKRINKYQFIRTIKDPEKGRKLNTDYQFDNEFRKLKLESKFYTKTDSLYLYDTYLYEYDVDGYMIKETSDDLLKKSDIIKRYYPQKMDTKNNPTVIWVYDGNAVDPCIVSYTEYVYYSD